MTPDFIDLYPALHSQAVATLASALAAGFVASLLWKLRA